MSRFLMLTNRRRTSPDHEPPPRDSVPPAHDIDAQPLVAETFYLRMPLPDLAQQARALGGRPLHPLQEPPLHVLAHRPILPPDADGANIRDESWSQRS